MDPGKLIALKDKIENLEAFHFNTKVKHTKVVNIIV